MENIEINCPRCGIKTFWQDNPSKPFCSERCRLADLGRWSNEEYSIKGPSAAQLETDET
ncbi:MAG: DNA gyrase inhibitor YacG [Deltaproteobacteria bacterium]|nr:DNA gyrase inhibitor YacG [Deltaproteobacteria bacterium]MCW8893097.1 DNA gyrase inhibitor YacG [Deltaproteobacteria bacterium]MCW9049109.1 DNA gyrase inhibitor YacG [Deltaproteobacteria bacterium]